MYLNKGKMAKIADTKKQQFLFGMIFEVIFILVFWGGIKENPDFVDKFKSLSSVIKALTGNKATEFSTLLIAIGGMIVSIVVLCLGVKNRRMSLTAIRLNQFFELDWKKVVTADQLKPFVNSKNPMKALKKTEKLITKGVLINCAVDYENGMRVVLYRKRNEEECETIICAGCGAKGKRRAGHPYECPYCGTIIK